MLVELWKKFFHELETSKQATVWQKIRLGVNSFGSEKSLKQVKDKLRNLKDAYKSARDHNKNTGVSPMYSPFFDEFDEILGTRDVINTPHATEIGTLDDEEEEERKKEQEGEEESQTSKIRTFLNSTQIPVQSQQNNHPDVILPTLNRYLPTLIINKIRFAPC